ncbi:MAG: DNA primase [bacterium]|jgi:DNA primase
MSRGTFTTEFIEEVRAVSDITAVIGEYVRLKKVGQNYVGLCPFHNEDTPSFSVNRERQMFYCFGCNVGGDVFEFIKKKEAVDFPEAVRLLAQRANLQIPLSGPADERRQVERQALYHASDMAKEYFQSCLRHRKLGAQARDYLAERGIDTATLDRFSLGFAPNEWESLLYYLKRRGVSQEVAVKAGLAIPRPKGTGAYDRFRGRLMFPIHDVRGRVVAFGGRILGPGQPKYLNSPETPIYRKARLLYALDQARSGIEREDKVLIVEGYLDVLACYQFGFDYAVASLGTALTSEQVALLKRYTTNISIAYDADAAGQTATVRGLRLIREAGCRVRVLLLPQGKDPDDFLHSAGAGAFQTLVEQAVPLPVYYFRRLTDEYNTGTLEGRLSIAKAMIPHLAGIENLVEREEYTKKVVEKLGLSQEALRAEIQRQIEGKRPGSFSAKTTGPKGRLSLLPVARKTEKDVLMGLGRLFLTHPEIRPVIAAEIPIDRLNQLPQAMVLKAMLALFEQSGSEFSLSKLRAVMPDEETHAILAKLAVEPPPTGDIEKLAADYTRFLHLAWVQRDIQTVRQQINSPEAAGKNKDSSNLIRRLAELHRRKDLLKQQSQEKHSADGWKEGGTRHAEK